jgi:hypothetical protein
MVAATQRVERGVAFIGKPSRFRCRGARRCASILRPCVAAMKAPALSQIKECRPFVPFGVDERARGNGCEHGIENLAALDIRVLAA